MKPEIIGARAMIRELVADRACRNVLVMNAVLWAIMFGGLAAYAILFR